MKRFIPLATAAAALLSAVLLSAQIIPSQPSLIQSVSGAGGEPPPPPRWPERDRRKGIPLTLSPQAEGKPALQYALLPKAEERQSGNAAVKYLAAMASLPRPKDPIPYELIDSARRSAPLAELDESEPVFSTLVSEYASALRFLKEGARLDSANWETGMRHVGIEGSLVSFGAMRNLSDILQLETRFDIKRRDWPAAREKICTGFALAHHLARDGETLIESLVGIAIANNHLLSIEDWIAQPGSPNLYWALSNLPHPFADERKAMDFDRAGAYFSLPELREFKEGHYSADGWTRMNRRFRDLMIGPDGSYGRYGIYPPPPDPGPQIDGTLIGLAMYPKAKQFLLDRGTPADQVEKMPTYEALERWLIQSYEEELDDRFKWAGMPVYEAREGQAQADKQFDQRKAEGDVNYVAAQFVSSLSRARTVAANLDRQIAMLRIIEAIRIYAADKAAFPDKLAALTLPVPKDPTTGEPFTYELKDNGKTAELTSPNAQPRDALKYILTLRR